VGKVVPIGSKVDSEEARKEARTRAWLMFEVLPVLAPKASVAEKRRLTNEILLLVSGKGRVRLTPVLLSELISIHSQCVLDQVGQYTLTIFVQPLVLEIGKLMGIGDETDNALRRDSEMCAAKPVSEEHFDNRD
jgi:hypothetical protein